MLSPIDQHSEAAAALRERGYKATSQRLVVRSALVELGRHVRAEELLAAVRDRLPNVSLPTIYASLEALEEAGLARRVPAGRGAALFDAGPVDHHHAVCRRCGAVEDVPLGAELDSTLASASRIGFRADGAEVVVHGLCAACHD
ncbi:MAG: transcriptional repressor [Solirubrobacterales bacterium]|nr:transcriptional repressor [Solirubrobacterales bacterium]